MKPLPWSHSALADFVNCPKAFHAKRVAKTVKEEPSEAMLWGNKVHKHFEDRQKDGTPLPDFLADHEPLMQELDELEGQKFTERKIALDTSMQPTSFFDKKVWMRGVIDFSNVHEDAALLVDYKGLDLRTPLPTPTGWTTMADVAVGDTLFDMAGAPCTVTGKSEVKNLPCYRITFDDRSSVVCDHEHLWRLSDGSVQQVTDIAWTCGSHQRNDVPYVDTAQPIFTREARLPVDPYIMGLWIADGTRGRATISKPDTFVWEEIQRRGYTVNMASGGGYVCPSRTVQGLRSGLRELGLLGLLQQKRIPGSYLRASYDQRLDLLRGLMDGDGHANITRKQCVYMTVDRGLADQIRELLCSLGQRPLVSTTQQHGFGKDVIAHPVSFRPVRLNPFLLPRKAERVNPDWGPGLSDRRRIDAIEQVDSVPTQCIAVDSPTHTFLCTQWMIPTHNTGKPKNDFAQLKLFALHTFAAFPDVNCVVAKFYWTKTCSETEQVYTRDQAAALWSEFTPDLRQYVQAFKTDTWQARPSGLCNGWCPVTTCEHWSPRKGR